MIGGILKVIQSIFPVIDKAIVDKDKARELKQSLQLAVLNLSAQELDAATKIILAEAGGESWLQRNWRPLTMLWFVALVGAYWLGFAPDYLVNNPSVVSDLFGIVQVGLGGYVVGRSAEKIVDTWKAPDLEKAKKGKENERD